MLIILQFHSHMMLFLLEALRYPFQELAWDSFPRWGIKEEDLVLISKDWLSHWRLYKDLDLQAWDTLEESAQRYQELPRNCQSHQRKWMIGTNHYPPVKVHIAKEELRQALIAKVAPKTVNRGINSLIILEFILITIILLVININHGIENYVDFLVCITMWLLSVGREW